MSPARERSGTVKSVFHALSVRGKWSPLQDEDEEDEGEEEEDEVAGDSPLSSLHLATMMCFPGGWV